MEMLYFGICPPHKEQLQWKLSIAGVDNQRVLWRQNRGRDVKTEGRWCDVGGEVHEAGS